MNKIRDMVILARPAHWTKNVFVLLPIVTAGRFASASAWVAIGLAAAAFCLASSGIYVLNDIADRVADRLHPRKKDRPLAAGRIGLATAAVEAIVLIAAGAAVASAANWLVVLTVAAYLALQIAYSSLLKRKMFLDVICVALGFVLRAVAGAVALGVAISPWLFVCTFTLCMFMGFCKRSNEIAGMGDSARAERHRPTLAGYTPQLLTHLITLSGAVAVIGFLMYASSAQTIARFGTDYLIYTLPIMSYAVFRFAMLSMRAAYADPTDLIVRDRPFQLTVLLWLACMVVVIRWGPDIQQWSAQVARRIS